MRLRKALIFAVLVIPAWASAQESGEPSTATAGDAPSSVATPTGAQGAEPSEVIVVTGSHIKSTTFTHSAPVQVIDRKQIESSGAITMTDVFRNLATAGGSDFNAEGNYTIGVTPINLRNLGLSSTLVLLNGFRMTPYPLTSDDGAMFVDLSAIPVAIIERIEILRDGGSALYGSDAVAGVVNIITRKSIDGGRLDASWLRTTHASQRDGLISALFGAENDKTNVTAVATFSDRTHLLESERSFSNGRFPDPAGNPGNFVTLDPTTFAPTGLRPDPGCGAPGTGTALVGGQCITDGSRFSDLVPTEQLFGGMFALQHHLTPNNEVFGEVLFHHSNISRASPQMPGFSSVVPANHFANPFGVPAVFVGSTLPGPNAQAIVKDFWHLVGGLRGKLRGVAANTLLEDWEWQALLNYSTTEARLSGRDDLLANQQAALNACGNAADLSQCYNPFAGANNSAAVLNHIMGKFLIDAHTSLLTGEGLLTGSLAPLPAGNLKFALGTQYRLEAFGTYNDHDENEYAYDFVSGVQDTRGSRHSNSVFAELTAPLFEGADLQAAARWENYTVFGNTVNPKASLSWRPGAIMGDSAPTALQRLQLRGSYGTAFRAPSVFQNFGSKTAAVPFPDGSYHPVETSGNTQLKPETATTWSVGGEWGLSRRMTLSLDWWNYNYGQLIVVASPQALVQQDPTSPNIIRNPVTGQILRIVMGYSNASSVKTDGLDLMGRYRLVPRDFGFNADIGTFTLAAGATFVRQYLFQASAGSAPIDGAGSRNGLTFGRSLPKWRANANLIWTRGGHSAAAFVYYTSAYKDDLNNNATINALATVDLSYSYSLPDVIGRASMLRIGATNVLDASPPRASGNGGYDPKLFDPRGRVVYANLVQDF